MASLDLNVLLLVIFIRIEYRILFLVFLYTNAVEKRAKNYDVITFVTLYFDIFRNFSESQLNQKHFEKTFNCVL